MGISLALIFLVSGAQAAIPEALPTEDVAKALVSVLGWEQSLKSRCLDGLKIGILVPVASKAKVHGQALADAIQTGGLEVQGMSGTATVIEVTRTTVEQRLKESRVCVLFLVAGVERALPEIGAAARTLNALVCSETRDHLGTASLVIQGTGSSPHIVIHKQAAAAQGAGFDARLLRFAEVVDAEEPR